MTIADFLAERLKAQGVRYVFGIPGGSSIPYMEAYRKAGIEYILVSGEASAGVMAAVTARLTGITGVCHATLGPGATNLTTGVGGALLDRAPVLAFTDEIAEDMLNRTVQMNIDHQKLYGAISKATFRLNPANAAETIEKAMVLCREEYPGPVHIGLPSNISGEKVNTVTTSKRVEKIITLKENETKIISLIKRSSNPIIAVGLTSARLLPAPDILRLLESFSVPVVVTPMAKGLIPESHPSYAGVLFHALSNHLKPLTSKADLVIGLGYDPVEYNFESWMPDVPLISFNTAELDMPTHFDAVQYVSAPSDWISLLGKFSDMKFRADFEVISSVRQKIEASFKSLSGKFGPVAAIRVLQEELPHDVILTVDVGSHLHLLGQYWETYGKKNLLMTNGWSGMGFGIPAALAASLAKPSSTIVCVTGDGGFLMTAGEVMTARRFHLPVIIVVLSDSELNLIRIKESWRNLSPYGTSLYSGDIFESDTFLGVRVFRASSEDEMRLSIRSALKLNAPVIINAKIDPEDYQLMISAGV
jgi:acetolactate synthase-1/2/3 large subunit